jgi:hypothetical protein
MILHFLSDGSITSAKIVYSRNPIHVVSGCGFPAAAL